MMWLIAQADAADVGFWSHVQAFLTFVTEHWNFCLLHFLEFAIWGAWFVVLGNLLDSRGFSRKEIGRIYGTMPIGSMITPLFIGPLADRYVNTEVIIGVSHLIGAVLLLLMARAKQPRRFYWLALVYALAYAPTLGLVNSIVFSHNQDIFNGMAGEVFPWIRVFGTLGWIAAGLSHAVILRKDEPVNEKPLLLACGLSIVLGLFAFSLPATPPAQIADADGPSAIQVETSELVGEPLATDNENTADPKAAEGETEAAEQVGIIDGSLQMLGRYPVFFTVTFVAAMAMGLYFAFAALFLEKKGVRPNIVGPVMTIGQWIEIFFMLTLPWFLESYGMKLVLLTGVCAWALRFGLFSIGRPLPLVLIGVAIHGICFDFFFAAGFINTDSIAPEGLTATAQTLYGFLVYGLGMYLGSEGSGWLNQYFSKTEQDENGQEETVTNWRAFWAIPCLIMTACAILFWFSKMG